ncbi:MAG: PTS sugar transporter subunit IIA [Desulfovibrionaceae bacterium]|nr:PTS sugar transporter subunit IIA [Desulfovibrionaceae bacterium]MBF0514663.1 PTS sugar transporter subunit IIA [Desulfovibrionaceae bacterium]
MRLEEFLEKDFVLHDLAARTKTEALSELAAPLGRKWLALDTAKAVTVLLERESLGSTGIGEGLAIPHGKMDALERIAIVAGRSGAGVDFDALDSKPCHIFFLVMAPEKVVGLHLRILAHISRLLADESFKNAFMNAQGQDGLWEFLKGY